MLGIENKPFKAVDFIDYERENKQVRIEEGMQIEISLCETGELIEGTVVKIQSKALLIHIEEEIGNREFEFTQIESIKNLALEETEEDQ